MDIVNELTDEITYSSGDEDDLRELQAQIEALGAYSERWRCPYCTDDANTYIDLKPVCDHIEARSPI